MGRSPFTILVPALLVLLASAAMPAQAGLFSSSERKLQKSVLFANDSGSSYTLQLLEPEKDLPPGTVEIYELNKKGKLEKKGNLTSSYVLEGKHEILLTPVPEKSWRTTLGMDKRPDFNRRLLLKDARGKRLLLRLERAGMADENNTKIPAISVIDDKANDADPAWMPEVGLDKDQLPQVIITRSHLRNPNGK